MFPRRTWNSGRTVDGLLGGSRGVDGGHESLDNGELVVEDLGQGREAVGRARRVTDDSVGRVVGVEVDTCSMQSVRVLPQRLARGGRTANIHGGISAGSGDDNLLGSTLEVSAGGGLGREDTSRLDDVVGASLAPGDGSRVPLVEDGDLLALDVELAVLRLDVALEASVGRVILEHVNHVVEVNERITAGGAGSVSNGRRGGDRRR